MFQHLIASTSKRFLHWVEDLRSHERSVEKQINRIFKGTIVCADERVQESTNHELSGKVSVERKVNERYGEIERKGKVGGEYEFNTDNNNIKFKVKGDLDTKGNCKVEAKGSVRW